MSWARPGRPPFRAGEIYVVPGHVSVDLPEEDAASTMAALRSGDPKVISLAGLDWLLWTERLPIPGLHHPLCFPWPFKPVEGFPKNIRVIGGRSILQDSATRALAAFGGVHLIDPMAESHSLAANDDLRDVPFCVLLSSITDNLFGVPEKEEDQFCCQFYGIKAQDLTWKSLRTAHKHRVPVVSHQWLEQVVVRQGFVPWEEFAFSSDQLLNITHSKRGYKRPTLRKTQWDYSWFAGGSVDPTRTQRGQAVEQSSPRPNPSFSSRQLDYGQPVPGPSRYIGPAPSLHTAPQHHAAENEPIHCSGYQPASRSSTFPSAPLHPGYQSTSSGPAYMSALSRTLYRPQPALPTLPRSEQRWYAGQLSENSPLQQQYCGPGDPPPHGDNSGHEQGWGLVPQAQDRRDQPPFHWPQQTPSQQYLGAGSYSPPSIRDGQSARFGYQGTDHGWPLPPPSAQGPQGHSLGLYDGTQDDQHRRHGSLPRAEQHPHPLSHAVDSQAEACLENSYGLELTSVSDAMSLYLSWGTRVRPKEDAPLPPRLSYLGEIRGALPTSFESAAAYTLAYFPFLINDHWIKLQQLLAEGDGSPSIYRVVKIGDVPKTNVYEKTSPRLKSFTCIMLLEQHVRVARDLQHGDLARLTFNGKSVLGVCDGEAGRNDALRFLLDERATPWRLENLDGRAIQLDVAFSYVPLGLCIQPLRRIPRIAAEVGHLLRRDCPESLTAPAPATIADIQWLTGLDSRQAEALAIVRGGETPVLVVNG